MDHSAALVVRRALIIAMLVTGFALACVADAAPGIDSRPSNTTCVAPPRPTSQGIALAPAFPDLDVKGSLTVEFPPGDSSFLYVMHRDGPIYRFVNEPDVSIKTQVLDLTPLLGPQDGQSGMMDMAFHPDFVNNGKLYVGYTDPAENNRSSYVAVYTSSDGGASFSGGEILLTYPHDGSFHGIGSMFFGLDGYLYISIGDGGDRPFVQDPSKFNGKILRLDVDGGSPYGSPPDNPYASGGGAPEVFALGLRNPWRVTQDRGNGSIWAGDVGARDWEEVNRIVSGGNYGWPEFEGTSCFSGSCDASGKTPPLHEYSHDNGCAVIGGYVYRGSAIPSLFGKYFFSDVCTGDIFSLDETGDGVDVELLLASGLNVRDFSESPDGEYYLIAGSSAQILQIVPDGSGGDPVPDFPQALTDTGCFNPADPTEVADGVIPYTVNSILWSDGAEKRRWFALPDGEQITIEADGDWQFPIGSVLIKEFAWNGAPFETRLMVRHEDGGWAGYTYEWNASLTDAFLVDAAGLEKQIDGALDWKYPSRAQCLQCHTAAAGRALGLETPQLNGPFAYPSGITSNQLETLDHIGLFAGGLGASPDDLPAFGAVDDVSAPLDHRARSYLHVNCSICHRPGGPGQGPMDFRFQTPLEDTRTCNESPDYGDLGVSGARVLIAGDASRSLIALRMKDASGANRMPPLGTRLVDEEGSAVIDAWIDSLDQCEFGTVAVPDVEGLPLALAEAQLSAAGFTVGVISATPSMTVTEGRVISQNPLADAMVLESMPVNLVISSGSTGGTNTFPTIEILAPVSGAVYLLGSPIDLSGAADDAEDSNLSNFIEWFSDREGPGPIGTGAAIQVSDLRAGGHVIEARVSDSAGASRVASVRINVADPTVEALLPSVADAFTRNAEGFATSNYGSKGFMRVTTSGDKTSFVRFDLSALTGPVTSAMLNLFVDKVDGPGDIGIYRVTSPWDEGTITALNEPTVESNPGFTFPVISADAGNRIQVDITSLVTLWQANPGEAFGIALKYSGEVKVSFQTREAANPPFIRVGGGGGPINTPPMVSIVSPVNGDVFVKGAPVSLAGSAIDDQEDDLSSSIEWSSSLDGPLGAGAALSVSALREGRHVITAGATDMGGLGATGTASVTITVEPSGGGGGASVMLPSIADAFTRDTAETVNNNYGDKTYMRVTSYGSKTSFVRFDLSGLTDAATSAVMNLFVDEVYHDGEIGIHLVTQSWDEGTITAASQPQVETTPRITFALSAVDSGRVFQVDISPLVAYWQANPGAAFGIALQPIGGVKVTFKTRESGDAPFIEAMGGGEPINMPPGVSITSPGDGDRFLPGQSVSLSGSAIDDEEGDLSSSIVWESSLDGTLGTGAGLSVDTLREGLHAITASATDMGGLGATGMASVTIVVSNPGGGSSVVLPVLADAFTRDTSSAIDTNYGTKAYMRVTQPGDKTSFVRFDTSSLIGIVTSASLYLFVDDVDRAGNVTVHLVRENWSETDITASAEPAFDAVPLSTFPVAVSDAGQILVIDVTEVVAGWQGSPSGTFGLALVHEGSTKVTFATRESASPPYIQAELD